MKNPYLLLASVTLLCLINTGKAQNAKRSMATDKSITGMTAGGGKHGYGVAYQYNNNSGKDTVTVELDGLNNTFGQPYGSVMQAADGRYYGMTNSGGNYNKGVIYYHNPVTGHDSMIMSFNGANGAAPYGNFVQAGNGLLYAMTLNGGTNNMGVLFSYNPATGKDSVLVNFSGANGATPYGDLFQTPNGLLYGVTSAGGANGYGTIFYYNINTGKDSVLFSFNNTDGSSPYGKLLLASDGLYYGLTVYGGTSQDGVIFSFDPSTRTETVLVNFNGTNGQNPPGSLIQAKNGLLYGLTQGGGTYVGVLFSYNISTHTETVLKNLTAGTGYSPTGSLFQAGNGLLYGLTLLGGANGSGTIFSFDTATKVYTLLHSFANTDGSYPCNSLIQGSDGLLYSTASTGGRFNGGTLYSFNTVTSKDSILYNFGAGINSNVNCITLASNGLLYGITHIGGTFNLGEVIRYNPNNGADSVIFNFNDTLGGSPDAELMQAGNGLIYGTASQGGKYGKGVLFSIDPNNYAYTVLVNFNDTNGASPGGRLYQSKTGLLYGTTWVGGQYGFGTLYSYNISTGKDSLLHSFSGPDGGYPYLSSVTGDAAGMIYGETFTGGNYNDGVLFQYNPATGKDTTIVTFNVMNGSGPIAILCMDTLHTMLYGAANGGGIYNFGALYAYNTATKTLNIIYNFNDTTGSSPTGMILLDTAAQMLYGTTSYGGKYNKGVLFRFDLVTGKDSTLINFDSINGSNPNGLAMVNHALLPVPNIKPMQRGKVLVYPNPFTNSATVVFGDGMVRHIAEIEDLEGRKIATLVANGTQLNISRGNLPAGEYLLKICDLSGTCLSTSKIMVQ